MGCPYRALKGWKASNSISWFILGMSLDLRTELPPRYQRTAAVARPRNSSIPIMLPTTVPAELELPALSPSAVSLLVPVSAGSAGGEAGDGGTAGGTSGEGETGGGGEGGGRASAGVMFPSSLGGAAGGSKGGGGGGAGEHEIIRDRKSVV